MRKIRIKSYSERDRRDHPLITRDLSQMMTRHNEVRTENRGATLRNVIFDSYLYDIYIFFQPKNGRKIGSAGCQIERRFLVAAH